MIRRGLVITTCLALLAAVVVGVRVADYLSGGGLQPTALLPADVSAAMVLDLDPALDQKLAIRALASHFPSTRSSSDSDLRTRLMAFVLPGCGAADRDVRPWLGSRVALALPSSVASVAPVVVVQIKSGRVGPAKAGLARMQACSHGALHVGTRDGYALLARNQDQVDRMTALPRAGSLGRDATYVADLKTLHGHQVATIWGDGRRVEGLLDHVATWLPLGSTIRPLLPRLTGRAVVGVHATGSYAEMQVSTIGSTSPSPGGGTMGPAAIAAAGSDSMAAAFTAPSLNGLVDALVTKVVPKSLTSLGAIGRLLRIPSLRSRPGLDGGRVLSLGPTSDEDAGLRSLALAVIPGKSALVLYVRTDTLPGVPQALHSLRAIGVVVTTAGTARIRIVV